ncbi:MAG: hypothetical protein NC201_03985 [Prevotella sp.]|nr:hypothetical protein [Bacteroides sp.]MCM1366388.1 hypothetical protein [Prevotella sp.]MCM1436683.1 hypothetical protein [Prevotella sp.]
MLFSEFVATRLNNVSCRTIEYKAITSFLKSIRGYEDMSVENRMCIWIADMIDRGLTLSSRQRYIKKLNTIYREYCEENGIADNSLDGIKELRDLDCSADTNQLHTELSKIEKIFDVILTDAKSRPELAVFLYLLFNVSTDIDNIVTLTTEEYKPEFAQLDDIINTEDFHHSRKYVFDLKQSRKRTPQLVKEVLFGIDLYLRMKGISFEDCLTTKTILALWTLKARNIGVRLSDIKQILGVIPEQFEYLRFIQGTELSVEEGLKIKHRVAEAFSPSGKRWYAMKVRRGFDFDKFRKQIKTSCSEFYDKGTLFYPQKHEISRVGNKIVTENVPVITDVVFLHLRPRHIKKIETIIRTENIGWFFRNANNGDSDYSVIDSKSMALFERMIGIFTPDIKIELTPEMPLGIGREVIITGGIMSGYKGKIYDIKEGTDVRQIYIRLSEKYSIKAEVTVEEFYVRPIDRAHALSPKF